MVSTQFPPGDLGQWIGYRLIAVAAAFVPIDIVFFALRFHSRHLTRSPMGMDDYLMFPSLFFCLAVCGTCIAAVHYGDVGYHEVAVEEFQPTRIAVWLKFLIIIPVTHLLSVTFPKLAIIGIYLRVFAERPYRIAAWVIFGFLIASCIANVTVAIFECIPVAYFWDKTIPGGRCINTAEYFKLTTMPSITSDVFLLILPLPAIWKLHISRNVKIGLSLTFLTGSIGLITSILRLRTFLDTNALTDGTWSSVSLNIWSVLEGSMYHIAACLPLCRPVIIAIRKRLPGKYGRTLSSPRIPGNTYSNRSGAFEMPIMIPNGHLTPNANGNTQGTGFKSLDSTKDGDFSSTSTDNIMPSAHLGHAANCTSRIESESSSDSFEHDEGGIHVKRDISVSYRERDERNSIPVAKLAPV